MSKNIHLQTISDLFRFFRLDSPVLHPLAAVVDFSRASEQIVQETRITADFYGLIFKNYNRNHLRYGRKLVDFADGSLICIAPGQQIVMDNDIEQSPEMAGWGVFFHPDLIRPTLLGTKIDSYSFFAYEMSEALHLSEKEKHTLYQCVQKIQSELQENIDRHSQTIIASAIELLLNYCTRFYSRQFITRKSLNTTTAARIEKILADHFSLDHTGQLGLPTVSYLAERVHLSPSYLSDLLKRETGRNAKEYIHYHVIEQAKNQLIGTDRSVAEIAYALGFEYPQYFNRLFRQKTGTTPAAFRNTIAKASNDKSQSPPHSPFSNDRA